MKKKILSQSVIFLGLILGMTLAFIALGQGSRIFWKEAEKEPAVAFNAPPSFAPIAEKIIPAVVTVYTTKTYKSPFQFDPGQFFFFFGPGPHKERGLGSGFIITPDGYILTNYHVIANADEIKVEVGVKEKKKYDAKKIGFDEKTDVALIKIEGKNLPTLVLGDSDLVSPGDWVLAVGSPFQFQHTLTAGIVSAKARHLGGPYDDFIQTDASINPGNSGGPLVNMRGEVIGMNSVIVSPSMGNVGLGFAIPINLIKSLIPELREKGKVVRSYLGVYIQDLTPELAESFGLKEEKGVVITQVSKDSPAEKAGLKPGDIILEVEGKKIESESQLRVLIASYAPGSRVQLKIFRNGQILSPLVVLELRPEEEVAETGPAEQKPANLLGIRVTDLTPEKDRALGYKNLKGALVVSVSEQSPLADVLTQNDLIVELNRTIITSAKEFNDEVAKLKPGQLVRIRFFHGQFSNFYAFRIPAP